jgi:hypothetical protein
MTIKKTYRRNVLKSLLENVSEEIESAIDEMMPEHGDRPILIFDPVTQKLSVSFSTDCDDWIEGNLTFADLGSGIFEDTNGEPQKRKKMVFWLRKLAQHLENDELGQFLATSPSGRKEFVHRWGLAELEKFMTAGRWLQLKRSSEFLELQSLGRK